MTRQEFEQLLNENLDPTRKQEVVRHLVGECDVCQGVAQGFWARSTSAVVRIDAADREALEDAVARATSLAQERYRQLEVERAEARSLLETLLSHPPLRRRMLIENRRQYQSWSLCELLIDSGHELRFEDPREYRARAETARFIAFTLDGQRYGDELVHDLRGRALAYLANATRVHSSDLPEVESLLEAARHELSAGTGDPVELFRVLSFERALRMRQKRYEDALALALRERELATRVSDDSLLGKSWQDAGLALRNLCRFEEALEAFGRAQETLDPEHDARNLAAARFNRIGTLDDLGRREQALEEMVDLRTLLEDLGDRLNLLRLRGMEGEFALSLEQYDLAEECFREARNGFIALDVGWEAAKLSLRLAQVFLLTGRTRETRELAEQILPIFRSAALTTEAIAAILLFREALLKEQVSAQLIRNTLELLEGEQRRQASAKSS